MDVTNFDLSYNYYSGLRHLLSPVSNYIESAVLYISKKYDLSREEAHKVVRKNLESVNIRNPLITFNKKNNHGDMVVTKDRVTSYLSDIQEEGSIIVPSLTTYLPKNKLVSPQSIFLEKNIKKRKEAKNLFFKFKESGEKEKAEYYEIMQRTLKIVNNSLSGAYGSMGTILYNPSAHYTLTSMTRALSSLGNLVTESMVSGNRLLNKETDLHNYIVGLLAAIKIDYLSHIVDKFNIYTPTPLEVLSILKRSSSRYWSCESIENSALELLNKLNRYELAAVAYINSFRDFRDFNQELVRKILTKLSKKCFGKGIEESYLKFVSEDITNLAKLIASKEITSCSREHGLDYLCSTSKNIEDTLREYGEIIHCFFRSNATPINTAYVKEILRDSIVLSDTDSTCGAYDEWVRWFYGKDLFTIESFSISASVMLVNSISISHNIRIFSRRMNVSEKDFNILKMKNEFGWSVFAATNNTKHYYANTIIQEGNIFKKPGLERKGVHLMASNSSRFISNKLTRMMEHINKEVSSGKKISLKKYILFICKLEKLIEEKVKLGDLRFLKSEKINEPSSYKSKDIMSTPYFYYVMWEEIFSEKYGHAPSPPYTSLKVPTTLANSTALVNFSNSIANNEMSSKLIDFCSKYNKTSLPTFRLPLDNITYPNRIPEELYKIIDYKRIIDDNLISAYIILETLGYYKKSNYLLREEVGYE